MCPLQMLPTRKKGALALLVSNSYVLSSSSSSPTSFTSSPGPTVRGGLTPKQKEGAEKVAEKVADKAAADVAAADVVAAAKTAVDAKTARGVAAATAELAAATTALAAAKKAKGDAGNVGNEIRAETMAKMKLADAQVAGDAKVVEAKKRADEAQAEVGKAKAEKEAMVAQRNPKAGKNKNGVEYRISGAQRKVKEANMKLMRLSNEVDKAVNEAIKGRAGKLGETVANYVNNLRG